MKIVRPLDQIVREYMIAVSRDSACYDRMVNTIET